MSETDAEEGERRKRGPYRTGVRRRAQILEAATAAFAQYGYAGTSLRAIAEEVGVSTPGLIRHFGSKEELFTAVLDHSDSSHTANASSEQRGLAGLRSFASAPVENVRNRGLVELLLTVAVEASAADYPARPFMQERYRTLVERLAERLREAGEDGEIREMTPAEREMEARGLVALMDGIELQWLLDPEVDLVGTYRHHFERLAEEWRVRR